MDWTLRELTIFVTAAETGSFTDAALELHISQAAVSRAIASLEQSLDTQLLRRVPRGCELTPAGRDTLAHAHRVLFEAEQLSQTLRSRVKLIRLGYAWAALGRHTTVLQRNWRTHHVSSQLELVRHYSATAGLAEGLCDVAVVRRPVDERRFDSVIVGLEKRVVAFATDDPEWSRRRSLRMNEIANRTIAIDTKVGAMTEELWVGSELKPTFIETADVDGWLDTIAAGTYVGTTSEATSYHHPRPGVLYRPVSDGPRIPVRLAWWRDAPPESLSDLIREVSRLYEANGD